MRYILFFILSSSIFFTSCTKDNGPLIMSPLEKLQGEWTYTKAYFVNNNGLSRENVLPDFIDWRVHIDGNFITMENLVTGQFLEGDFEFYTNDNGGFYDEDGIYMADMENYINVYVTDTRTSRVFIYDWQINYLTRNKLHFGENFSDGNYSFKMIKL